MAATKRDYYEVLGVPRNATGDDIRRAYRRLARQYHPDVSSDPDAESRFKEVNEAYEVLSNEERRARYDRFGHAGVNGQFGDMGGFGGFSAFGDIFNDLFNGFGMGTQRPPGPERGADLRYDLTIEFEEAVFGAEKEIEVTRLETCPTCGGSGAEPGTQPMRCPECNGRGQVRRVSQSIFLGQFVNVSTCPRCGGTGEVVTAPCHECHGQKRVSVTKRLSIKIPPGVDDGTQMRLAGEGEDGLRGGPKGNLYVVLSVKPHPFFPRGNNDLYPSIICRSPPSNSGSNASSASNSIASNTRCRKCGSLRVLRLKARRKLELQASLLIAQSQASSEASANRSCRRSSKVPYRARPSRTACKVSAAWRAISARRRSISRRRIKSISVS